MKPHKLVSNVMHGDEFYEVEFDPKCNVTLLQGGTGHGKGAIRASLQLCLQGTAYIDRQHGTYSQGSKILSFLNPGYTVEATLYHSKGESSAKIIPRKNGSVPRDFHKGWKDPYGADIAQSMRDIIAATPDTMAKKLVAMIVKGVTQKEICKDLDDATIKWLGSYFAKKSLSTVEALEAACKDANQYRKNHNSAWKDLVARKDEFAVKPRDAEKEAAQEDRLFWSGQETALNLWESQQQRDGSILNDAKEAIARHEDEVARLQSLLADIDLPDKSKVAVYEAAAVLANFADTAGLEQCPYCDSTDQDLRDSHKNIAARFTAWAEQLANNPAFVKAAELREQINQEVAAIDLLNKQIALMGVKVTTTSKPKYERSVIQVNLQEAEAQLVELNQRQRRWDDEQERKKKQDAEHVSLELWKARCKSLNEAKACIVDSRIGEFIERTRYFMPDPKSVGGGVLHIDIASRQIGFLRNGRLHLSTSGSETEMIAIAMALAAGSTHPSKPVIFLGDVGWGVEALEACLNTWTKYGGHVVAQTTAKVRASQLNNKVQVIKPKDITKHAKTEFEPVAVVEASGNFVERPDDYETSTFRFAAASLSKDDKVLVEIRNRSKTVVTQRYEAVVQSINNSNVTVNALENFSVTINLSTGKVPFTEDIVLVGLPESVVTAMYHKRLHARLGYPATFKPGYTTAKAIWDNMIHASDAEARQDLIA